MKSFWIIGIYIVFNLCVNPHLIAIEQWYFLPNFHLNIQGIESLSDNNNQLFDRLPLLAKKKLSPVPLLTGKQQQELVWKRVSFPHRDFTRIMPQRNVYGWYGCQFDVPEALLGMDIIADLGIIDDTDATYVNGKRIGGVGEVGQSHGTAWQTDRIYRIAGNLIKENSNYLAVHVWNLWGLGGMVGPPVLAASLAPSGSKWEMAFPRNAGITYDENINKAKNVNEAITIISSGDNLVWNFAEIPWKGYASWNDDSHYSVFRLKFDMKMNDGKPRRLEYPVIMDVGQVFDVAAFYLNGKSIGLVGRFPSWEKSAFSEAAKRGQFLIMPEMWNQDGRNELMAIVYRERGTGGLPGIPGIILKNLNDISRQTSFPYTTLLFNAYLNSQMFSEARATLEKTICHTDSERVWLLSNTAYLAFLEWMDGGERDIVLLDKALSSVAAIFQMRSAQMPQQSAMQAFCRILRLADSNEKILTMVKRHFPLYGKSCRALPPDRRTLGDWPMAYGNKQYILSGFGKVADLHDSCGNFISFNIKTGDRNDPARKGQPSNARFTDAENALVIPASQFPEVWKNSKQAMEYVSTGRLFPSRRMRRAAWWDDHGEMHPFDDEGPNLHISLDAPIESGNLLSLYLCDFDWRNTLHPRQQSILFLSENGGLLNAIWSGKSDLGVYERVSISSQCRPQIVVLKHRGACVAVSGVFIDTPVNVLDFHERLPLNNISNKILSAYYMVLNAERNFAIHDSADDFLSSIQDSFDAEDVLSLLGAFEGIKSLHPLWQYALIGRLLSFQNYSSTHNHGRIDRKFAEISLPGFPVPLLDVLIDAMGTSASLVP